MLLPFTEDEKAYLRSPDTIESLNRGRPLKDLLNRFDTRFARQTTEETTHMDYYERVEQIFKTYPVNGDLLYAVVIASQISDPKERLLQIIRTLSISKQMYECQELYGGQYSRTEWIRDPHTAPRFGPEYRDAYLQRRSPPNWSQLVPGTKGVSYANSFVPENYPYHQSDIDESRYFQTLHSDVYIIKGIALTLILKTLGGPNAGSYHTSLAISSSKTEPFTAEMIRELFIAMCFLAEVQVTDITVKIEDGFPIFEFRLDGLPFSTLPGGILGPQSGEPQYLIKRSDVKVYRYGTCYPAMGDTDDPIGKEEAEAILWWLINSPVVKFAKYRKSSLKDDMVDPRAIDNLPELIWRASLTPSIDPDTSALRDYLSTLRDSARGSVREVPLLVVPKGKYIRRRIREWLDANPSILRFAQPKELPDRAEYCVDLTNLDALPEALRPWFQWRVWLVPNPYNASDILTDTVIEQIVEFRQEELTLLIEREPSIGSLPLREQLFRLDSDSTNPDEWTEMTRYCHDDFETRLEQLYKDVHYDPDQDYYGDIYDDDYSDDEDEDDVRVRADLVRERAIMRAKRKLYCASRGLRSNANTNSYRLIEAYSGNRSRKEIEQLLSFSLKISIIDAAEMMRYPYPWRLKQGDVSSRRHLEEYIREGKVEPLTEEIERESIRYRFFKTMSVEQHRQASSLYLDDPETPMTVRQYTLLTGLGAAQSSSTVSPLDPIYLDLSNREVFDETVRRLGVVFPLGSNAEEKRIYLINGLYIYNRILTRDPTRSGPYAISTDSEIIERLGVYPFWKSTEELRRMELWFLRGEGGFFVPVVPRCLNRRTAVGFETIEELNGENRFIIAYGTLVDPPASGSFIMPQLVSWTNKSPKYLCYTLPDLAAGFRPGGVHNDILRYAVFDSNGNRKEISLANVDTLVHFVKSILHILSNEEDRIGARELLDNIVYMKRHLVKRTERDHASQRAFGDLGDPDRETVRNYLSKLFEYGMYLRRWKGPGHAYPMREADTLCSRFDMNSDLIAPTGRLHEAHRVLSSEARNFVDSLPMKHYISGTYSESSSMTVMDLIYQLNRQDDDNMCIRMGSTKVIGSAFYYLELFFDPEGALVEGLDASGSFAIEELDHIQ